MDTRVRLTVNSLCSLMPDCSSLLEDKKKIHDTRQQLFAFKIENQKGTFSLYFCTTSEKEKKKIPCILIKKTVSELVC